jgi:hypothetical protein
LDLNPSRYASGEWRLGFAHSAFEELHEVRLLHDQILGSKELLAFFASIGWIADLPRHDRARLLDEVRTRLAAGEYRRPWETRVHWTRVATSVTPSSPDLLSLREQL